MNAGALLTCLPVTSSRLPEDAAYLNGQFPDSLSYFGAAMILHTDVDHTEAVIEQILETIRGKFKERCGVNYPSRLSCLFATDNLKAAEACRSGWQREGASIWAVGCDDYFPQRFASPCTGSYTDAMSYLQIVLLALIQGMAELLPVSSTAHVILAERLMGLDPSSPELTFLLVMLHTGTMFAVLSYFWPRWKPLLLPSVSSASKTGMPAARFHFVRMVVLATAFTGVLGLGLKFLIENVILIGMLHHEKAEVEHLFKNLPLIGTGLFLVGLLILASGSRETKSESQVITPTSSIWIGLVQGLCLPFRGFSRSGATISTALFCGIARPLAEDFSFALAVVLTPPVILWELRRLLQAKDWQNAAGLLDLLLPGVVGMVFSFIAGLLALKLLSAALEKGRWKYFGFYCLAASLAVFAAACLGP